MTLHQEWDVLNALFNKRKELKVSTKIMWADSNQDENSEVSNLSISSQANVHADKLATTALKKLKH